MSSVLEFRMLDFSEVMMWYFSHGQRLQRFVLVGRAGWFSMILCRVSRRLSASRCVCLPRSGISFLGGWSLLRELHIWLWRRWMWVQCRVSHRWGSQPWLHRQYFWLCIFLGGVVVFLSAVAGFWVSVGVAVDDSIVVGLGYGCYIIRHANCSD